MAGRADADGMVVAADRDGGGTVVDLVGDTDTRTEVERRRHRISPPPPVRNARTRGLGADAVVEQPLAAAAHLDAGAAGALHEFQAPEDKPHLRLDVAGDQEVVRQAVHGHAQIGLHGVMLFGDARHDRFGAIGDDDSGAVALAAVRVQRPRMGRVVERRTDDLVDLFEDDEIGDARPAQLDSRTPSDASADDDDVVGLVGRRHRKPVRFHSRRAIGPIRPTSSRNAASGAKPATCTSCRCGLRRATRLASRASSPVRR